MNLSLPTHLAKAYKNKSQIARATTEPWVAANVACPECGGTLSEYRGSMKGKDVYCESCGADFQIKSSSKPFKKSIVGAEYSTTLNSVKADNSPSFMLLHYNMSNMMVVDFQIIHRSAINEDNVIPRKPLSKTARRAGWQGCFINIDNVSQSAKTDVVKGGVIINSNDKRNWLSEVLAIVNQQAADFVLTDLYKHESALKAIYPNNKNIKAKIRQQLQIIRKMGVVECTSGKYSKMS